MSYGAELLEEMEVNYAAEVSLRLSGWWRMKSGRLIRIVDMTDTHLINTINMLRRRIDGSAHDDYCWDTINMMENELKKRGIEYGKDYKR